MAGGDKLPFVAGGDGDKLGVMSGRSEAMELLSEPSYCRSSRASDDKLGRNLKSWMDSSLKSFPAQCKSVKLTKFLVTYVHS